MKPLTAIFLLLLASVSLKETVAEVSKPVEIERELSIAEHMLTVSNSLGVVRRLDPTLCQVAQGYADLLARTHQKGHFADGTPWYRAKRAGFTGTILFNERPGNWYYDGGKWKREIAYDVGEVLAFGPRSERETFDAWMKSSGHRAAVLEPSFDVCGFGQRGTIYVGVFGKARDR